MGNEMKIPINFISLLIFVWLLCICCLRTYCVSSQCHDDEKSLLLELKNNLTFTPDASDKLRDWNESVDCCQWNHVECDNSTGRVIGLELYYLNITGGINNSSSIVHLQYLQTLDLGYNYIQGSIPTSIFTMPSLQEIFLDGNKFSGQLNEFVATSSMLQNVYLSNNSLEGPIPKSIFQLQNLKELDLSFNKFNGTIKLVEFLQSYKLLQDLDLGHNYLSVDTDGCGVNSSFAQLQYLVLVNCNLHSVPEFLKNQTSMSGLDLSMNKISGKVPQWIWGVFLSSSTKRVLLDLSSNSFVELEIDPYLNFSYFGRLQVTLDLHSNNFHGKFPIVPYILAYLDCSNNHFTSIDPDFGPNLFMAYFLSFSNNNLRGSFPAALQYAINLNHLNLEFNHLNGNIPDYFINMSLLNVVNLRGNNLKGSIPAIFGNQYCYLETLDLNGNFLQGRVPRSLANCKALQVLDLGNNQLNDTFPCHLKSLPKLQVLILRSNKFYGTLVCPQIRSIWPMLQIVDLASNHFSGELNAQYFFNWTSMMAGTGKEEPKPRYVLSEEYEATHYQNSVTVTFKGNTYELQYILTVFSIIDFSNNFFHGELPKELGNLNGLIVLNLSHNSFSGKIPLSFGNLSQIQSLDLSCNALSDKIPPQLANLNFLEYLNLSFNKLSGRIPTSTQLQSFNASSFQGNQGLYGPPLTPIPRIQVNSDSSSQDSDWISKNTFEWMLMGAEAGFPVGITVILGPLLYIKRYREWYCNFLHILVMKILRKVMQGEGGGQGNTTGSEGKATQQAAKAETLEQDCQCDKKKWDFAGV